MNETNIPETVGPQDSMLLVCNVCFILVYVCTKVYKNLFYVLKNPYLSHEMELNGTDIHNHILPGVDDGFRDPADSLEAIRLMTQHGCSGFVFTPHLNPDVYPDGSETKLREAYASFVSQIPAEWNVKTSLAAEYMVVGGFEKRAERPEELLTYQDGSILIEMSYYFRSPNLEQTIFNLQMSGLNPILAHPERYLYMAKCLSDFDRLRDMGCRFQMNLLSLSGCYGPESMKILKYLKKKDWYDFSASDLHSVYQLEKILSIKI